MSSSAREHQWASESRWEEHRPGSTAHVPVEAGVETVQGMEILERARAAPDVECAQPPRPRGEAATQLADGLAQTVQDLAARLQHARERTLVLARQLSELEGMTGNQASVNGVQEMSCAGPPDREELDELRDALLTVLWNSDDLAGLAALARHCDKVQRLVYAYARIARMLAPD